MNEQPDATSPAKDLSRVVGQATSAIDRLYNLGTPHRFDVPSIATESLTTAMANLSVSYSRLVPDYSKMFADMLEPFRRATENLYEQWFSGIDQFTRAFSSITNLADKIKLLFPSNWDVVKRRAGT